MTVEQVEEKMKVEPKKVYVDIYTDWCYWCKVMEKNTFTNNELIAFMNENYYCIHLDAESKKPYQFNGKQYGLSGNSRTNELAVEWTKGQLSYPTSIFFDEGFANPQPVPGYLDLPTFEMISKYISENKHKSIPFEKYKATFKSTWKK
ncbi:MAG: SoxW [Bacteroidetes bacterium OLB11]|nr:MAG: SoxW [Bacteroidetes bacterium OLB11]